MPERIKLDSPAWDSDHWDGVDDPREELSRILQSSNPTTDEVDNMLEGTYYVDNPSPHFYYLIPYLLDIFEKHPSVSSVQLFCTYLHRAKDGRPSERCLEQLDQSRSRIVNLLLNMYQSNFSTGKSTYHECKWILAALATACDQSDLGRQITGIGEHDFIN